MAIVQSIAWLAAKLQMSTTAEGIETPDQLDRERLDSPKAKASYSVGPNRPGSSSMEMLDLLRHLTSEESIRGGDHPRRAGSEGTPFPSFRGDSSARLSRGRPTFHMPGSRRPAQEANRNRPKSVFTSFRGDVLKLHGEMLS